MKILEIFKNGLSKISSNLSGGFKNIFQKKNIDEKLLNEFEELLISSDVGVTLSSEIKEDFKKYKIDKKIENNNEILKLIAEKLSLKLLKLEKNLSDFGNNKPAIIVVSGVNGVGKTTTIGKLGKLFKDNNKSVNAKCYYKII